MLLPVGAVERWIKQVGIELIQVGKEKSKRRSMQQQGQA